MAYIFQFLSGGGDPSTTQLVLIWAAVVGGSLVGAGIIWEAWREGHLFTWPTVCVFFGVIIEAAATICLFEFDERIIRSQNDEIIALDKKLAPRLLSGSQLNDLGVALKPFAGQKYAPSVAAGAEAAHLFCEIDRTLIAAGWLRQNPTGLLQVQPCPNGMEPRDKIDLDVWSGVRVHTRFNPEHKTYEAANVLVLTLKADDIEAEEEVDATSDPAIIKLAVGIKF